MVKVGEMYECSDGKYTVEAIENSMRVTVRFVSTGYVRVCQAVHARDGRVKDRLKPRLFGVGFIGDGERNSKKDIVAYNHWQSMLQRCYDRKWQNSRPTYKGCKVDERWHNFQNFAEWHEKHYFEGAQLDKDLSAYGERGKLYSPETCAYVTPQVNGEEAAAKFYKFTNPSGETILVYNLKKFSRDNDLEYKNMHAVHKGKRKSCGGWRKAP